MSQIEQLKKDIQSIQERNKRVEADKAWEISLFRKISILVMTYIIASAVLWAIGNSNPLLNALIPTAGFYLSTVSLPFLKKWWVNNRFQ